MNRIFLYFIIIFLSTVVILPQHTYAASNILYQNDFEDEDISNWTVVRNACKYAGQNANWQIIDGKIGIKINGPGCVTDIIPNSFSLPENSNYKYSVDVEYANSSVADRNIFFKYKNPSNWYGFHTYSSALYYHKVIEGTEYTTHTNYPFQPNTTYHYDIEVINNEITLAINGDEITKFYDPSPYLNGATIALSAGVGADPDSEVWFDNIVVTEISDNPQLDVPHLMQVGQEWSNDLYDHSIHWPTYKNSTIGASGCAMTSTAMILQYYGINVLPDNSPLNPGTLNSWLIKHHDENGDGYLRNGAINWLAISAISKNSATKFNNPDYIYSGLEFDWPDDPTDEDIIADLEKEMPIIMHVNNEKHFVVATGYEDDAFLINDPLYSEPKKLTDNYNGEYQSIRRYIPSNTDLSYILLAVDESVDIYAADSNGNNIGFQQLEQPVHNQNGTVEFANVPLKTVYIQKPESGEYKITISSNTTKPYLLDIYSYDQEGHLNQESLKGFVSNNLTDIVSINFDKENAEDNSILREVTFQSTIEDVTEAVELKQMNKGLGSSMIALLSSAMKDTKKDNTVSAFIAEKKLEVIEKLLDRSKGKKQILSEGAYQILKSDVEQLKNSL